MYARAITILSIIVQSSCIAVNRARPQDIVPTSKVELKSLEINCEPNDLILITAPVAYKSDTVYHLHKPNGELLTLHIDRPKIDTYNDNEQILVKYVKDNIKVIKLLSQFKIFNLNHGILRYDGPSRDEITMRDMKANEFLIGPLGVEDHGNWVLSFYVPDIDGKIIEMFQIITIRLIDTVPPYKRITEVKAGDTFTPGFAYAIKNLESCEIIAPRSSFDRFFDRNQMKLDNCGFIVPNVTDQDVGIWRIIGVGNIVYETETLLLIKR